VPRPAAGISGRREQRRWLLAQVTSYARRPDGWDRTRPGAAASPAAGRRGQPGPAGTESDGVGSCGVLDAELDADGAGTVVGVGAGLGAGGAGVGSGGVETGGGSVGGGVTGAVVTGAVVTGAVVTGGGVTGGTVPGSAAAGGVAGGTVPGASDVPAGVPDRREIRDEEARGAALAAPEVAADGRSATEWVGADWRAAGGAEPPPVVARAVPAAAAATAPRAIAALSGARCAPAQLRRRLNPGGGWAAAGHRKASASASSASRDRPRCAQSGP
jgi:hypothetical protein